MMLLLCGCTKENPLPAKADFSYVVKDSNYSVPVRITFTNKSTGGERFKWTFEGGEPGRLDTEDPGTIVYNRPGIYQVQLTASNNDGESDVKKVVIKIDSAFNIHYIARFVTDSFPAATVRITNTSQGPETYQWTFAGGQPAAFSGPRPGNIVFADPGDHLISLTVSNGRKTQTKDTVLHVAPHLAAAFSVIPDFDDRDWEAPVKVYIANRSISATQYNWSAPGATVTSSTQRAPSFIYRDPGTYTITLVATNGKETQQTQQTIVVLPNTNLRVLNDVSFGINTAQNTTGCYFSTAKRKVYPKDSVVALGNAIDVVFYGLNAAFTYNRFVAPDMSLTVGLEPVPGGLHTQYINSLESCNCGVSFTPADFDAMTTDARLQATNFSESPAGLQPFTSTTVPRIILFKTAAGIKGAIKIKRYVSNGQQSYIVADLKYQKQP
ncbi:PKD domain-containing protein [Hymenobacter sp. BT664]|uniref:PKD domain-containing protein n=2 Tax=Hymenobacter montanus TaxID=2771359 RepID=A0A927BE74_9BACT|nr:PKD domain-containing protein [Hymenobacter montanus]